MRTVASLLFSALLLFSAARAEAASAMAKLSSVVDGNTLLVTLRGVEMKVRFHGIAIPPADEERPILKQLNIESAAFLKKYLSDGWVYLEFPTGSPAPDKDGFVPAFIYRGSDATFLNEKLVTDGLALVNQKEKSPFTDGWKEIQEEARQAQRGIWGSLDRIGGEKIAKGVTQGKYIGVPGATEGRSRYYSDSYVTRWVIFYYY